MPMQEMKPVKLSGFAKNRLSLDSAQQEIIHAYNCEKQAGELLLESDEHKQRVLNYIVNSGIKHLDVELADLIIRCQTTNRTKITYFIDKIKQKFSKEIVNEVIDKKYIVSDIDKLKSVMKQYGVPPQVLKDCLLVTESVNNHRIDELFEQGHIDIKKLKGCYELSESTTIGIKELSK